MLEDNTPTVTARRRKPAELLRLRLETARRLQGLNKKTKAKRAASKAKRDKNIQEAIAGDGNSHGYEIAPRVQKLKKNKLSQPLPPDSKFKKRQRGKTWLPTHMYHAKRAQMTAPNQPLWRFALPLSPTEKSYRPTHRAAGARGAIAWDKSYISTIQLEGSQPALQTVLRAVGVDGDDAWGKKAKKWQQGSRSLQKWIYEREGDKRPIAPVTMIWCARSRSDDVEMTGVDEVVPSRKKPPRHKMFIRVHPSAFLQTWTELLAVSKKQNPPVMVEDLRFDIGSIEITGPGSTEALISTLRPFNVSGKVPTKDSPEAVWPSLLGVTNPSSLPANALLAFTIDDPRLHFPLQRQRLPTSGSSMSDLAGLLSSWPPDRTQNQPLLFDRAARLAAGRQMPSQKAINRRRTLAGPGAQPPPQSSDPQIPVTLLATRAQSNPKNASSCGMWTLLLPWKCVISLWYMLMYCPLSSGGNPRFGGLKEQRQLSFESGQPWFPGDYPGTPAGWEFEERDREERKKEWERRPKGRRIEFDSVDLGNGQKGEVGRGWACDWERLVQGPPATASTKDHDTKKSIEKSSEDEEGQNQQTLPPLCIHHLKSEVATALWREKNSTKWQFLHTKPYLATVRVTLCGRGTPTPCARIYRLPSGDSEARKQWLSLASPSASNQVTSVSSKPSQRMKERQQPKKQLTDEDSIMEKAHSRQRLAASLLESSDHKDEGSPLPIPPEADLIGFITSGNYNLAEGKGTGIGSILLSKVFPDASVVPEGQASHGVDLPPGRSTSNNPREKKSCIVRSAGERVGRVGVWEFV